MKTEKAKPAPKEIPFTDCPWCDGTGRVFGVRRQPPGITGMGWMNCEACHGTGEVTVH